MLGKSHLMVGAGGWLLAGVPVTEALGHNLSTAEIATGTVVAAGAAMLPDLDHPQATVSRSLGPVTGVISRIFSACLGGHRNGSHSLLFAFAMTALLAAGLAASDGPWLALAVCFFASSLVLRVLTEAEGIICAVLSAIIAATLISISPRQEWIYLAFGLGILLHDFGDFLTPEGIPPLWPISKVRVKFPIIGHTGDWREKIIATLTGLLACVLLVNLVYAPLWQEDIPKNKQVEAKSKTISKNLFY